MEQGISTEKAFGIGTVCYNSNFSMSNDIIIPIAKSINLVDKAIISDFMLSIIIRDCNSAKGFIMIDKAIKQAYNKGITMVTREGNIFRVASGVSKTALCIVNSIGVKSVIKYNNYPTIVSEFEITVLRDIRDRFYQQVQSQKQAWHIALANGQSDCLLPPFKNYDRYNAVIEPYAENVGEVQNILDRADIEEFKRLIRAIGINDMHCDNYGIWNGKIVAIDYGL